MANETSCTPSARFTVFFSSKLFANSQLLLGS
jgi:hypothetical protein